MNLYDVLSKGYPSKTQDLLIHCGPYKMLHITSNTRDETVSPIHKTAIFMEFTLSGGERHQIIPKTHIIRNSDKWYERTR